MVLVLARPCADLVFVGKEGKGKGNEMRWSVEELLDLIGLDLIDLT